MAHWRDSYLPARLGPIDARAGIPLLAVALHARIWTAAIAFGVCLLFWFIERRGMSIPAALRAFRSWVVGKRRPPLSANRMRGSVDLQRREF